MDSADGLKGPEARKSRASWARLLRRVFEVEMTYPVCGVDFTVVSVITEPETIDRILAHVRDEGVDLLFDARSGPDPRPGVGSRRKGTGSRWAGGRGRGVG